jgi:hypothetical protein
VARGQYTRLRSPGGRADPSAMARAIQAALLALYGGWLLLAYRWHFVDGANLLFHEAGHVFFAWGGPTLHMLGGTLGQLFFPIAAGLHFLRRERVQDAAVCVVWLGESWMNIAVYAADAQAQTLPLVGGEIHDWHWLLSRWGVLPHCHAIAFGFHALGALAVLAGVAIAIAAAWPKPAVEAATGAGL